MVAGALAAPLFCGYYCILTITSRLHPLVVIPDLGSVSLGRVDFIDGPAVPSRILVLAWAWRAATDVTSFRRLSMMRSRLAPVTVCSGL